MLLKVNQISSLKCSFDLQVKSQERDDDDEEEEGEHIEDDDGDSVNGEDDS